MRVTTPVRGRLLDRFPYGRVLWPLLVLPPIGTITRVMWRARVTFAVLPTALALDAVLTDIGYVVGPVLAIGMVTLSPSVWAGW